MAQIDSFDKIVQSYFSAVTKQTFTYKGKTYKPKSLCVSTLLFRDYTCPKNCGGCCPRFSLDYLPFEEYPLNTKIREIIFNNKKYVLYSDTQKEHINHHCCHLDFEGRCAIHKIRPFSCDFELIRILAFKKRSNIILTRLFGRGWNMLRIDGERGALCEITPITEISINDVIRKLKRLQMWCDYFNIENKVPDIILWANEIKPFLLKNYPVKSITL